MKKILIVTIAALLFAGNVSAMGPDQAPGQSIRQAVHEAREEAEQEGRKIGTRIRQAVQSRTEEMRNERKERSERGREKVEEMRENLPDQARKSSGVPKGLTVINQLLTTRYEVLLEDVGNMISYLKDEDLTDEQADELDYFEEEMNDLWEDLPERAAKSYFEEFEDLEHPGDFMPKVARAMSSFRGNHSDFASQTRGLYRDVKEFYREIFGEEYEREDDENGDEEEDENEDEEEDGDEENEDDDGNEDDDERGDDNDEEINDEE